MRLLTHRVCSAVRSCSRYPEPTATKEKQLERQNTYDWAHNATGTPFHSIWENRTSIKKGLGRYNNPGAGSPNLHPYANPMTWWGGAGSYYNS